MARKKTKTRAKAKKKHVRPVARPKAKAKAVSKAAPKVARARAGSKGAPGSDVERRWNEYWACRTQLEEAVELVKSVREALQAAQDTERACRSEFESIKASLTDLLDVEPAGGPQRSSGQVQGLPAPQSVPGAKTSS